MGGGKQELKIHFCLVLGIKWDPNACELYDDNKPDEEEAIATSQAQYVAFGTFDVVADENAIEFNRYFQRKLNHNNTVFGIILSNIVNKWFSNNKDVSKSFELVSFTIESDIVPYIPPTVDLFIKQFLFRLILIFNHHPHQNQPHNYNYHNKMLLIMTMIMMIYLNIQQVYHYIYPICIWKLKQN